MTEAEGAAIAELVGVAKDILKKVLQDGAPVSSVEMDEPQKQRLLDGYTGVMNMLLSHRRAALKKLGINNGWMKIVANENHQELLRDEKGIPLLTPVERPVLPLQQQQRQLNQQLTIMERIATGEWAGPHSNILDDQAEGDQAEEPLLQQGWVTPAIFEGDWIRADQADHDQPDLFDDPAEPTDDDQAEDEPETITETAENGATLSWPAIQGVPEHIMAGLIQSVRDNQTKAKACAAVAKETGLDKFEVSGFFEELVKQGIFEKRGSIYVAHMPNERPPAEASIG